MKIKDILFILSVVLACSCKSSTRRWLDGLADYRETHSANLSFQALKIEDIKDTSTLSYRVRIVPSTKKTAVPANPLDFWYKMDSCFYLQEGTRIFRPAIVQAVPNGIKGCFEYLVSFELSDPIKQKKISLVYRDRYIDGRPYRILLNKQ